MPQIRVHTASFSSYVCVCVTDFVVAVTHLYKPNLFIDYEGGGEGGKGEYF